MSRKAAGLLFALFFIQTLNAQFYAGMLYGANNSVTFKEYAGYVNSNPDVTGALENFKTGHGFSVGFEMPGRIGVGGVLAFNYRHFRANTDMQHALDGNTQYRLRLNQYLIPIGVGKTREGFALLGYFITGVSHARIEKQYLESSLRNRTYTGRQLCYGLGASVVSARNKVGWMARIQWVGNMMPGYRNRQQMFDRSYFDDNAWNADPYRMQYRTDQGEIRNVKSDFRGLSLEVGLFFRFMDWEW